MNAQQLQNDLNVIEKAVQRADAPEPVKRLLGEMLEWNRALVKQVTVTKAPDLSEFEERLAAVEDFVDGADEGISFETAKVLVGAFEQARLVNAAVIALVTGGASGLDDLAAKKLLQLVHSSETAIVASVVLIGEITVPDEEEPEVPADEEDDEDAELEDEEGDEDADVEENA